MIKVNNYQLYKKMNLDKISGSIDPLNSLKGKNIVLGITGGIAAYKSCQLIRDLINREANVRVVTTESALKFVTPLTLRTLSNNPVISQIFDDSIQGTWHIDYAQWADLVLIAPATMNTIAKIANGFCDNPVTTMALSKRSPMLICPAADEDMYNNPISQLNFQKLISNGIYLLDAESGFLASGLYGVGRLPENSKILDACETVLLGHSKDLRGKNILVTAGPTFEDIDPVRFIGNRSSGKMGYSIAKAAFMRGANVKIISGVTHQTSYSGIPVINVRSAQEMLEQVKLHLAENDILIMASAVADYKPAKTLKQKIKKTSDEMSIELIANIDILKNVDKKNKFIVGFALETENHVENAVIKLKNKNISMIILNPAEQANAGFEVDTNSIKIIDNDSAITEISNKSKFQIAHTILDAIKEKTKDIK